MIRKLAILTAVVALPFSAFAASSASAGAPKVDVSQSTVTCNTVTGTAAIKPSLVNGGTSPTLITVKGTLGGCTVTSGNSATNVTGSFTGKLTGSSNDCLGLVSTTPLTGNLIVKWKADATTPLVQTSSTISVTTISGGLFAAGAADPSFGAAAYGEFSLGSTGVTGAFAGTDAGATSSNHTVISQDVGGLLAGCGGLGIKAFNLGIGTFTLA